MGVKMGWIQIKMGHPLAQNGAALAPFRANGAHPYPSTFNTVVFRLGEKSCARSHLQDVGSSGNKLAHSSQNRPIAAQVN